MALRSDQRLSLSSWAKRSAFNIFRYKVIAAVASMAIGAISLPARAQTDRRGASPDSYIARNRITGAARVGPGFGHQRWSKLAHVSCYLTLAVGCQFA